MEIRNVLGGRSRSTAQFVILLHASHWGTEGWGQKPKEQGHLVKDNWKRINSATKKKEIGGISLSPTTVYGLFMRFGSFVRVTMYPGLFPSPSVSLSVCLSLSVYLCIIFFVSVSHSLLFRFLYQYLRLSLWVFLCLCVIPFISFKPNCLLSYMCRTLSVTSSKSIRNSSETDRVQKKRLERMGAGMKRRQIVDAIWQS